jgi:hypothetical protein
MARKGRASAPCRTGIPLSLLRQNEIEQVRRLLAFFGGHQQSVPAEVIVLLPDEDLRVVFDADRLEPFRQRIGIAQVFAVGGPRPRQRVVDDRDLVVQDVGVVLVVAC